MADLPHHAVRAGAVHAVSAADDLAAQSGHARFTSPGPSSRVRPRSISIRVWATNLLYGRLCPIERPDALLVAPGNSQFVNRRLIVEFAAKNRLPIMYAFVEAVLERGPSASAVYINCGVSSCHCRDARALGSCLKQYAARRHRGQFCSPNWGEPVSEGIGRLLLLMGLPGSGKTTLAIQLAASLPACRMCPDDWMMASGIDFWDEATRTRIEAFQADLSLGLLRAGQNVVIEWGVWAREERDALRNAARKIGAQVELHYLTATTDELWKRIVKRDLEGRWARGRYRGTNSMNGRANTNHPSTTSSEPTTATRFTTASISDLAPIKLVAAIPRPLLALADVSRHCTIPAAEPRQADVTPKP